MRIEPLRSEDQNKAIDFAITGMHFDAYLEGRLIQRAYGRWFWYKEHARATQVISAYEGDVLAGVMLAEMYGETPQGASFWKRAYVKLVDLILDVFFKGSSGTYDDINRQLLEKARARYRLDGEISFLAANPDVKVKGIGTALLEELARREKGKRVFLYTDDQCTYQFYEHRGFERVGEVQTELDLHGHKVPLLCLLYTKML